MFDDIYNSLQQQFPDSEIQLVDFSNEHHGHGAHVRKGSHIRIYIKSKEFAGKSKVQQQQMVNRVLKPYFEKGLHAVELSLDF
ncbi:MAG: BolA family protein [Alphaproteobacteria bacterium]